jgi:serine/threonine-protein kinase RsbW
MAGQREEMEISIPSDFKYLGAVDSAVQDVAREFSFPQKWINDLSTALVEACTNAIEHGNKFSKKKRIRVIIKMNGNNVTARVHDQGEGFNFGKHLADLDTLDPLSERGRGIIIMDAFTDQMNYSFDGRGGFFVELVKSRVDEDSRSTEGDAQAGGE